MGGGLDEIFMIYVKVSFGYMEGLCFFCLLVFVECYFCILGRVNILLFLFIWLVNKMFNIGYIVLVLIVFLLMFFFDEVIKKEFII